MGGVDGAGERLLGELLPVGVGGHGEMKVSGSRVAQSALQQDLSRGRLQEVGAAHDVGDRLLRIIDHDRELVTVKDIAALQHEVAHVARHVLRDVALHAIFEFDRSGRDDEALRDRGLGAEPEQAASMPREPESAISLREHRQR